MTLSRRKMLAIVGGGSILAASSAVGYSVTRMPQTAQTPWKTAGRYGDPRMNALSYALLAPNPHNRQPWLVELDGDDAVVLHCDLDRLLPETDPFSRQITIGLGCFLEMMRMAAASDGYRVDLALFPEGSDSERLDQRPVAHARFVADPSMTTDPLFAHAMDRRSLKEPFDLNRPVPRAALRTLAEAALNGTRFGATVDAGQVDTLRRLTHDALIVELETPRTYMESVDLFRIGHREVDTNPDGIDFTGPMFETLRMTGLFSREVAANRSSQAYKSGIAAVTANADTAMGHSWLTTQGNSRVDQITAGMDWVRVNLAATSLGLGFQPLSQALQEYPEMGALYREVHGLLAEPGETIQMLVRLGYGPEVGQSPRWPLDTRLV